MRDRHSSASCDFALYPSDRRFEKETLLSDFVESERRARHRMSGAVIDGEARFQIWRIDCLYGAGQNRIIVLFHGSPCPCTSHRTGGESG